MPTMFHIFVDSREPSVSFVRDLARKAGSGELGRVEHVREETLLARFRVLLDLSSKNDLIFISMRYLSPETLSGLEKALSLTGFSSRHIIVACYACFTHVVQWCRDTGCRFEANPYKTRKLKLGIDELLTIVNSSAVIPVELDRLWVQYRLMLSIISRSDPLGLVSRQLIMGMPAFGSELEAEYRRALRYYKLGEPDMAGGSYSCEQGQKNAVDRLRNRINKVAVTDFNVLIRGESGTGKEAVAWAIHELSSRRDKPFFAINCAGLPDELLESEMFGYTKGSHNQAWEDRPGLLESAAGGTLFLDELPDMSARIQAKLLRFVESGEYRPLGGGGNRYADVRIVAAGQPERLNGSSNVRPDLRSRIGEIVVEIAPLRELEQQGPGTISKIVFVLLERYTWAPIFRGGQKYELTPQDIKRYQDKLAVQENISGIAAQDWKESNVRELNNFLRQWIVFGDNELQSLVVQQQADVEEPRSYTDRDELQDRQLREFLVMPHDRKGLEKLLARRPMKRLKHAYARHVFKVYRLIVEQENLRQGTVRRATQKELAGLMGITENSLSRYLN